MEGCKKEVPTFNFESKGCGRGDLKDPTHIFKITFFGYNNSGHILSLLLVFNGLIG